MKRPKSYQCDACDKWFTSSGHLKRHFNTTLHKNAMRHARPGSGSGGGKASPSLPHMAHQSQQQQPHMNYMQQQQPQQNMYAQSRPDILPTTTFLCT